MKKKLGVVNPTGPLYVGTGTSFRKLMILEHSQRVAPNSPKELLVDGTKSFWTIFWKMKKKLGVVNPTGPLYVGTGTSFRKLKILGHSYLASTRSTYDTFFRLPPCHCTISRGSAGVLELPGDAASPAGGDRTDVVPLARRHGCRTARRGHLAVGCASSRTRQQLVIKILNKQILVMMQQQQ